MDKELSHLGIAITASNKSEEYDESIKDLLADKRVLAWILQGVTEEFTDLDIEEIIPLIQDPLVSKIPVEPGLSNEALVGTSTESRIRHEGIVYYDVRFVVSNPKSDGKKGIHIIVDVEAQKDPTPGYDLVTRGFLYTGRMLSEQMGKTVTGKNYDKLEKVYSIWIVFNCNREIANTTTRYSSTEFHLNGKVENDARYDMAQVVMIRLPKEGDADKSANEPSLLHSMLYDLFVVKESPEEKIERMSSKYGLRTTSTERRINRMCNLSEALVHESIKKGREEERANTERERQRADELQMLLDEAKKQIEELKRAQLQ